MREEQKRKDQREKKKEEGRRIRRKGAINIHENILAVQCEPKQGVTLPFLACLSDSLVSVSGSLFFLLSYVYVSLQGNSHSIPLNVALVVFLVVNLRVVKET